MWLIVLGVLALPAGAAVFFLFDRLVFRDETPRPASAQLTSLHLSGR